MTLDGAHRQLAHGMGSWESTDGCHSPLPQRYQERKRHIVERAGHGPQQYHGDAEHLRDSQHNHQLQSQHFLASGWHVMMYTTKQPCICKTITHRTLHGVKRHTPALTAGQPPR